MKFGLENITRLCAALDHPERAFRSIIVAGTNGKGSVTAMVDTALRAAGHRAARYTSPHLERLEERYVIGGRDVDAAELESSAATVREAILRLERDGPIEQPPTFFEAATAIAFDLFRRRGVEIAVLEVGLGGRLDATNVVTPVAAGITSIDFDHRAQLGDTLEQIAFEKAGVIKPGIPVVCGPLPPAADAIVRTMCAERGARYVPAADAGRVTGLLRGGRLALEGAHQMANAGVAIALLDQLESRGIAVGPDAIRRGLTETRWPGRLERFTLGNCEVLVDAAHNPAGARALASYLEEQQWTDAALIFGAMGDKDVDGMIAPLADACARIVCTTAPTPRAMPAAELADVARRASRHRIPVTAVDDPEAALDAACAASRHVVAAGSIFLIGPLRGILRRRTPPGLLPPDSMRRFATAIILSFALACLAAPRASAQDLTNCKTSIVLSDRAERSGEGASLLFGTPEQPVQIDCDEMQFFADYAETRPESSTIVGRGHVVYVSGSNRISADRMEFNTKTRTGVFYNAFGTANLGDRVDRSLFGTQEPDAYFYGEELHKVGPKKYKIVRGGFTTCVQPEPRWKLTSGSVTLNLDDYVLLKNAILNVKGVPLMYLPVFYYPVQEDDRATGFLLPTYGTSTVKGSIWSNAFFWAIGRSHDATIFHDWMTKAGHQVGGEYRYVLAPGSQGNVTTRFTNEKEIESTVPGGSSTPAQRSFHVTGDVAQQMPLNLRARATADFFSNINTQQLYQQDIYRATQSRRRFGGNVSGAWGSYVLSATLDRVDTFGADDSGATSYYTNGSLPRINLSRGERPIGSSRIYFGANGEYVTLLSSSTRIRAGSDDVRLEDKGLSRFDVAPVVRIPFTRWPFLTVNSAVLWRGTYWTESLSVPTEANPASTQIDDNLFRQYWDLSARIVGPVFNKIWDTPNSGYAKRWKHVIQPTMTVQRITGFDVFDRIVRLEGVDQAVGSTTRVSYGLINRLYAKKDNAREILLVNLAQSYYSNPDAAKYDGSFQTSQTAQVATNFSPVGLQVRGTPTDRVAAEFRTEWDPRVDALRSFTANGTMAHADWLNVTAGWSLRRVVEGDANFGKVPNDHFLNAATNLRTRRNRLGGTYSIHYDLQRDRLLEQRVIAYYNAQCCGVGFEYQTFNLQGLSTAPVPKDRRFNISFTLAGIGTFSNLFGAFGGQQNR
jgi:dihydrofolate synthase/folylpolyglutamate synthase